MLGRGVGYLEFGELGGGDPALFEKGFPEVPGEKKNLF